LSRELHPAENRGYRELYAYARGLAAHWPGLADRFAGMPAERPLREGADAAASLITELERTTPDYGLYGKPAAQGVGDSLAKTRRGVRDRFLERNQAVRFAVSDVQHVVTLLGYLEQIARTKDDERLRGLCSEQRARLMAVERSARAAAIELGSSPDEAIQPLDRSAAGRVAHGAAYAVGTVGEWFDRRASGR
jgi:hypothetical protein